MSKIRRKAIFYQYKNLIKILKFSRYIYLQKNGKTKTPNIKKTNLCELFCGKI